MLTRVERLLCWVLSGGPVPVHVALVMDGNRRFARLRNEETTQGHKQGAEALKRVAAACAAAGVRVVSVYGFALGNYHRQPKEVEGLLGLAEALLRDPEWIQGFFKTERIRLVVVGDLTFVGPRLRAAAAAAEKETENNTRLLLRLCVSYGARHEVYRALTAPQQQQQHHQQQQQERQQEQQQLAKPRGERLADKALDHTEGESGVQTAPAAAASAPTAAAATTASSSSSAAAAAATAAAVGGGDVEPLSGGQLPICAQLRAGLLRGKWQPDDPTRRQAEAFWMSLQGGNIALPEVLIRTSGEARLSDFLLCEVRQQQQQQQLQLQQQQKLQQQLQVSEGCFFYFIPSLWPDIRPWHLLLCLLHKQVFSRLAAFLPSPATRLV
ncbi:hypothetical protein Efla_004824 [Eimeria flavescens]